MRDKDGEWNLIVVPLKVLCHVSKVLCRTPKVLCCPRYCAVQGVVLFKVLCCYSRCCAAVQGVVQRKVLCRSRCYAACPRYCAVRRRSCAMQGVVLLFKVLSHARCCAAQGVMSCVQGVVLCAEGAVQCKVLYCCSRCCAAVQGVMPRVQGVVLCGARCCAAVQGVVPLKVLIRVSKVLCFAPKALCPTRCCAAVQGVVSLFKVLCHARGCAVQGVVPCKVLCSSRYSPRRWAAQDAGLPKALGCPRRWAAQGTGLPKARPFPEHKNFSRSTRNSPGACLPEEVPEVPEVPGGSGKLPAFPELISRRKLTTAGLPALLISDKSVVWPKQNPSQKGHLHAHPESNRRKAS